MPFKAHLHGSHPAHSSWHCVRSRRALHLGPVADCPPVHPANGISHQMPMAARLGSSQLPLPSGKVFEIKPCCFICTPCEAMVCPVQGHSQTPQQKQQAGNAQTTGLGRTANQSKSSAPSLVVQEPSLTDHGFCSALILLAALFRRLEPCPGCCAGLKLLPSPRAFGAFPLSLGCKRNVDN